MQSKSLAVVLLLVVVGALSWIVFGGSGTAVAPIAPPPANTATPAAGTVVGERADAVTSPAGEDRLERTAVTPAPRPAVPTAAETVRVRGRLVDAKGEPRARLDVAANMWPGGADLGLPLPMQPGRPNEWQATSGADGVFVLELPRNRDGALHLRHDELVFAAEPAQITGSKGDQDLGDLVVLRGGALQGFVRDANGHPVGDVKVAATVGGFGLGVESSMTTAADGAFSVGKLRPGTWTLRTASSRYLPTTLEVGLAAEERRTDLVLTVLIGDAIAGQVVDERGVGVADFKVGSKRREMRGAMDIERFSADEATTTDARGYFTLAGLQGGTATIRAFGAGHTAALARDVVVGTGDVVLRVERLAVVEGVLVAGDGTPIAGSRVSASRDEGTDREVSRPFGLNGIDDVASFERTFVKTAADGSFRLESVPPGAVVVEARGQGHLPVRHGGVQVLAGQAVRGVRLVADAGATARVEVVDGHGQPVAGAEVRARRVPAEGEPGMRFVSHDIDIEDDHVEFSTDGATLLAKGTSDAEGIALLTGLPAIDARFEATHEQFAKAPSSDVALPRTGTTTVRLVLQAPGFAEVRVFELDGKPAPGVSFRIAAAGTGGGDSKRGTTDAEGRAKVGPLTPGDYSAVLVRDASAERVGDMVFQYAGEDGMSIEASRQTFVVVADEVATVEIQRPLLTRLHGRVLGVDGAVPGCVVELVAQGDTFALAGLHGGRQAETTADGAFAFDDVEPGNYTLRYGKSKQLVKANTSVDVVANVAEQRRDLVLRLGVVQAQVVAADSGDAIEGAEVELERDTAGTAAPGPTGMRIAMVSVGGGVGGESMTMTVGRQVARTDAEGRVRIEDVPVGSYTVRINHRGCASVERKQQIVVEQRTTDCGRIDLAVAGSVRGSVVDASGVAVQMALVQHHPVGETSWSAPVVVQDGTFRVASLAAGRHTLRARHLRQGASGPELEVEVVAGETATVELRLP